MILRKNEDYGAESPFNPIRSGVFEKVNDPGGGALKDPLTISKSIASIVTISCVCMLPGVSHIFQLEFFKN